MIKNKYVTANPAVASYDYFDLAQQIGYISFYGALKEGTAGTPIYRLFREQTNTGGAVSGTISPLIWYSIVTNGNNQDIDFDFTVTRPMIVEGDVFLDCCMRVQADAAAGADETGTLTVKLYHYDGSTETQLGGTLTLTQQTGPGTSAGATFGGVIAAQRTLFKSGDTLRLNILVASGGSGHASSQTWLFHEPQGSSTSTVGQGYLASSALKLNVPIYLGD